MKADFFKKYDFESLFFCLKEKYKKYGKLRGKIYIEDLKKSEVLAFEELGKYYKVGDSIVYTIKELDEFLMGSIYEVKNAEDLLMSYCNGEIEINSKKKERESLERDSYFQSILECFIDTEVYNYFNDIFFWKKSIYKTISLRYNEDRIKLKNELKLIGKALNKLFCCEGKMKTIAMFSDEMTGDPHYFDEKEKNFVILYEGIKYMNEIQSESESIIKKNEILYKAGLIREGLLNNIAVYGFKGKREDMRESRVLNAANEEGEYIILSIDNINSLKTIESISEDIYVFENPSIFSYVFEKIKKIENRKVALICTSGQLNFAAYKFLEKLSKKGKTIYYSGDIDPEGILIAVNLKKKFEMKLIGYSKEIYINNLSGKMISAISLKKLENINDEELIELIELVKSKREAVYQESFVEKIMEMIV